MNKSESIVNLAKALAAFNLEVEKIDKDGTNPHFKNQYSTLDNIIDHVKPLLAKQGISVLQFPSGDGERVTVSTIIVHTSGEFIQSEPLIMKPLKADPQGIGSCITYARRYSLSSSLSLSLGEDDDGNNASNISIQRPVHPAVQPSKPATPPSSQPSQKTWTGQSQQPPTSKPAASGISQAQINLIQKLLKEKQVPDEIYRDILPKESTKELTGKEASEVISKLQAYVPFDLAELPFK